MIPAALSQHWRLTKDLIPRRRKRQAMLVPADDRCIKGATTAIHRSLKHQACCEKCTFVVVSITMNPDR